MGSPKGCPLFWPLVAHASACSVGTRADVPGACGLPSEDILQRELDRGAAPVGMVHNVEELGAGRRRCGRRSPDRSWCPFPEPDRTLRATWRPVCGAPWWPAVDPT